MDGGMSKERLLCAYMADRDGIVKLRMPFDEEQLEALMDQETTARTDCVPGFPCNPRTRS